MYSSEFFGYATMGYIVAMIMYIVFIAFKNERLGFSASIITIIGFSCHTIAFIMRWLDSYSMGIGRAPLTNLYESIVFFVWCLMLGYLVIEYKYKYRFFGAFVTPIAGMALGFVGLTGMSQEIQPLVPALKSNWLLAHVTMSFIAYSAFALSFVTALLYLVVATEKKSEGAYIFWTIAGSVFFIIIAAMGIDYVRYALVEGVKFESQNYLLTSTFLNPNKTITFLSYLVSILIIVIVWHYGFVLKNLLISFKIKTAILDELTYKMVAVGFPIFTLGGLIFGAIWADQAWGVYWSWDPKETWSLITWLFYAGYLHARMLKGWRGNKVAIIAVVGFITVVFTYLGVNIFLAGLHSYGDLS
ncbi:MAG: c-type cytochrome biogenesis protein CcsB [Candidatus Magnetoovum sp. WYHC-5]|nr:c-type cytochrome biogenesis protein CcsB [Candidatus Magnetoovum sp. WYHC-5]